jgi:transcriptional regulator with XRE-family HTH domain
MQPALTTTAAKELGRSLRFFRHARSLTLRDVARSAGLSSQYVQNIERGERGTVSEGAYTRFAKALAIPDEVVLDLIMKARVHSALEQRGLATDQVVFVWRGVEQRLAEQGIDLRTDISKVVVDIIG